MKHQLVIAREEEARRRAVDYYFLTKDDELIAVKSELRIYKIGFFLSVFILGSVGIAPYLG